MGYKFYSWGGIQNWDRHGKEGACVRLRGNAKYLQKATVWWGWGTKAMSETCGKWRGLYSPQDRRRGEALDERSAWVSGLYVWCLTGAIGAACVPGTDMNTSERLRGGVIFPDPEHSLRNILSRDCVQSRGFGQENDYQSISQLSPSDLRFC